MWLGGVSDAKGQVRLFGKNWRNSVFCPSTVCVRIAKVISRTKDASSHALSFGICDPPVPWASLLVAYTAAPFMFCMGRAKRTGRKDRRQAHRGATYPTGLFHALPLCFPSRENEERFKRLCVPYAGKVSVGSIFRSALAHTLFCKFR